LTISNVAPTFAALETFLITIIINVEKVVLLNILVETVIHFVQSYLINRQFKEQRLFEEKFSSFSFTFDKNVINLKF